MIAQPLLFNHGLIIIMRSKAKASQISKGQEKHFRRCASHDTCVTMTGLACKRYFFHFLLSATTPLKSGDRGRLFLSTLCRVVIVNVVQDTNKKPPTFSALGYFGHKVL